MFTYDGISTTLLRDERAAARDRRRHDAHAGGGEALRVDSPANLVGTLS